MTSRALIGVLATVGALASAADGQVYATGSSIGGENRFYSINTQTGVATPLSDLPVPAQPDTTTGLGFTPAGAPFGIALGHLVRPDFAANTMAMVGPLDPVAMDIFAGGFDIMADGRAFTYQTNEFSALLRVNLSTGATTEIGAWWALLNAIVAAGGNLSAEEQPIVTGMGSIGTTLYGIDNRTATLFSVDTATGDAVVPSGMAGQLTRGTLADGTSRDRFQVFSGLTGYDSNNDGQYDRLLGTVAYFDWTDFGGLIEINPATGSWELIGTGNAPVTFYALGSRLGAPCIADFNGSGTVSVQDIFDFLAAYFSNSASADVNGSGTVSVQDIFDYLAAYFAGCR